MLACSRPRTATVSEGGDRRATWCHSACNVDTYYKCRRAIQQGRHKQDNGACCANRKIARSIIEKLVFEALVDSCCSPNG